MGLAERALEDLRPDSPVARIDAALRLFVDDCESSSREGYAGCALESLGLVTRHLFGRSMVEAVDQRLADPAVRGFFWHGVGRAVYFSPENLVPRPDAPWPVVSLVDRQSPHGLAHDNMVAGVAWAMNLVNLRQPAVLEGFLRRHAAGFADSEAFVNGLMSSAVVRTDTTPDDRHLERLLEHEVSTPGALATTWERVVRQPVRRALAEIHPEARARGRLGEVFRFHPQDELLA
jgi:hypothetical protein